jgi:hypothetical protein
MGEENDTYCVTVHLKNNTQPIHFDAVAAFEKGSFFCVAYFTKEGIKLVDRFPISDVFRIREEYRYL